MVAQNNNNDGSSSDAVVPGIGDAGCRLPAPSGVNMLPLPLQAAVFFSCFAALYAGTAALVSLLGLAQAAAPGVVTAWKSTWPLLGVFYILAGVAHFTLKDAFMNMMPQRGAWGLWYVPGSKAFHVAWTGVAEAVLGGWMAAGAVAKAAGVSTAGWPSLVGADPVAEAAALMLVLTLAVTPANIYMFSHGARLLGTPDITVPQHAFRLFLQCVLLAFFYEMAVPALSVLR